MASIEVVSNRLAVNKATEKALKTAARMIGGSLAGHAAEACPVDTGLLRNSITFAIGGESTAITDYHADKPDRNGEIKSGHYEGDAPDDDENEITVYIGTNVEHAPYLELGHAQEPGRYVPALGKRLKADHVDARPFLRPAVEGNQREILQIIEKCCREIG